MTPQVTTNNNSKSSVLVPAPLPVTAQSNDMNNANSSTAARDDDHHHTICENKDDESASPPPPTRIIICGAGIVGLTLALALHRLPGASDGGGGGPAPAFAIELHEKAASFHEDAGAGMGLYPNGLRVLRDLNLLRRLREEGCAYLLRRIQRHDGTDVAVADESALAASSDFYDYDVCNEELKHEQQELQSMGIRRWRLLQVLYDAVLEAGMPVHFGQKVETVRQLSNGTVEATFSTSDDHRTTARVADIFFGADGTNSRVRDIVGDGQSQLKYTGVTCLMGIAEQGREERGICFPSSLTTQCHACYFPTGRDEQCFQIHFPVAEADAEPATWGTLSEAVAQDECARVAEQLRGDGWDESYVEPLTRATRAVQIGFCSLEPPLKKWVYGDRIVLIGDACHVPVPYTGMGAQMGLEDVGVLSLLVEHFCFDHKRRFHLEGFGRAMKLYQEMRIPRTEEVNQISKDWGASQQRRATCQRFNRVKEERIRRDVFFHTTMSNLFPGVSYDYREEVHKALRKAGFDK